MRPAKTTLPLLAALCLSVAVPALAQNRDSDGDVISVIKPYPIKYYYRTDTGDMKYYFELADRPVAIALTDTGADAGGTLQPVTVAGQPMVLERSGNDVYLLNPATGDRVRGQSAARVERAGRTLTVNPRAFSLD